MQLLRMIGLAILTGSIGAGAVWFGWGLIENAYSLFRNRTPGLKNESEEEEIDGDGAPAEAGKAVS